MASYLTSTGKVDSSGKTTINGGLNKRGRRTSYRYFNEAVYNRKMCELKKLENSKKGRLTIILIEGQAYDM